MLIKISDKQRVIVKRDFLCHFGPGCIELGHDRGRATCSRGGNVWLATINNGARHEEHRRLICGKCSDDPHHVEGRMKIAMVVQREDMEVAHHERTDG